ncbi:M23 family metallopeptidase [Streptomyces sp. Je 1-332]|uniref:M23 family metallopeptidase n=1 Tax=Streptomyces sp. Je 1-332 TaxID=3231270 RepID=UPI003458EE3E
MKRTLRTAPLAATAVGLATALTLTACGATDVADSGSAAAIEKDHKNNSALPVQNAQAQSQPNSHQSKAASDAVRKPMRRLWMPLPCGQKWRVNTWDAQHWPALDMVREPQHKTEGSTVRAAASGTVRFAKWDGGAGNVVQIKHSYGYYTTYLHLKKRSVKAGQKVKRTTKIGTVGQTGSNGNTPHLHFEVAKGKGNANHWGEDKGDKYRKVANLYPKTYNDNNGGGPGGGEWRNQVSHSCSAPKPTKWAPFKVVKEVNKRKWAGTKYESSGKLKKGKTVMLGCNHTRKPDGKLYRRLDGGGGADGRGLWVRSSTKYVKQTAGCSR